jgi:hypothetical protein
MKRIVMASIALLTLGIASAPAQFTYPTRPPMYGPGYQPQLSPYLNMLRGGDPAANFFIGVVPEMQRRQDRNIMYGSIQGLLSQLPTAPGITEQEPDSPMDSTGHPTAFNYTGMYFNSTQMGQGAASAFPQRRGGQMPGGQRPGMRPGMPGQGGGGSGVWPNMMGGGMRGGMMPR